MSRIAFALLFALLPFLAAGAGPSRDFSGKWILDERASNTRDLDKSREQTLNVTQDGNYIAVTATRAALPPVQYSYSTNGGESRFQIGEERRSSMTKWEGDALLINTIVSASPDYTISDRWKLSRDLNTLTVTRQISTRSGESEGSLVYRREGTDLMHPDAPAPQTALTRPPAPPAPDDYTVTAGTRIAMTLRNAVDTKHSREGDRVYLETSFPVSVNNRIVVPRGSYVSGTITSSKPAGTVKKGELFIRFDSLILPNGVTKDFRSRLGSADSAKGQVDRDEGSIKGERDNSTTAKRTAEGAGAGAGIGGIAGAASGHALGGLGIGAAAGAAVGLASVMLGHKPEAVLPRGTNVEMILDRDLVFTRDELRRVN